MVINTNHHGRTSGGRYTWRPLVELEPDDFPPDSKYWQLAAVEKCKALYAKMGEKDYHAWLDGEPEPEHWRGLYDLVVAKAKEVEAGEHDSQGQSNPAAEACE